METEMSRWEEYKENLQSLRAEYGIVVSHWRFLQSTRLLFTGTILSAFVALFGVYRVLSSASGINFDRVLTLLVPFLGIAISLMSFFFERLLERMISGSTKRGRALEESLKIRRGIFFSTGAGLPVPSVGRITIPDTISFLYLSLFVFWTMLFAFSVTR
jgi:hypothetical protein